MKLRDLKIRCISLYRAKDRRYSILSKFDNTIMLDAVDGMQWASGEYDEYGRPLWKTVPENVTLKSINGFEMFPTTYACNLSHLKAMKDFLRSKDEWTIIIEDDVEPVGDLTEIDVPDDADWFYLIGSDHPGCRLSLYLDGQVQMPRTLAAYALSRRAAELAIMAMEGIHYYQTDWQIPIRCFESMRNCALNLPKWEELPYRIKAYGPQKSIIRHNEHAAVSTFTADGRKPWIPEFMLPQKGDTMEFQTPPRPQQEETVSIASLKGHLVALEDMRSNGILLLESLRKEIAEKERAISQYDGAIAVLENIIAGKPALGDQ